MRNKYYSYSSNVYREVVVPDLFYLETSTSCVLYYFIFRIMIPTTFRHFFEMESSLCLLLTCGLTIKSTSWQKKSFARQK